MVTVAAVRETCLSVFIAISRRSNVVEHKCMLHKTQYPRRWGFANGGRVCPAGTEMKIAHITAVVLCAVSECFENGINLRLRPSSRQPLFWTLAALKTQDLAVREVPQASLHFVNKKSRLNAHVLCLILGWITNSIDLLISIVSYQVKRSSEALDRKSHGLWANKYLQSPNCCFSVSWIRHYIFLFIRSQ